MTTPPPTPPTTPQQGASGFGDVLVSARSFAEYRAMFDLADADLAGSVLDCPGGAASFTAEARRAGVDVVAVDPTYPPAGPAAERGRALRALGEHAAAEAERGSAWVRERAADFVWTSFPTPEDHLAERLRAAGAFAAHACSEPDHYVQASLPRLPFADGAVDLVAVLPPALHLRRPPRRRPPPRGPAGAGARRATRGARVPPRRRRGRGGSTPASDRAARAAGR
ncbi:MAG: hypothetical protein PGN11_16990 [Quadrisphaera sp.]